MSFCRLILVAFFASLSILLPATAAPLDDALKTLEAGSNPAALEVLRKHAGEGNTLAQVRLGSLYYHGQGVEENETLAVEWWKKAAASGSADAMYQIAHAYLFGNTIARSVADPDREAAIWCFRAANAGHAEAAYALGLLFIAGKGVAEDRAEAVRWFRAAAAKGHVEARKAIETTETAVQFPAARSKR